MNTNYLQSLLDELFGGELPTVGGRRDKEGPLTPSQLLEQEAWKTSFSDFFQNFGSGSSGTGGTSGGTSGGNSSSTSSTGPKPSAAGPAPKSLNEQLMKSIYPNI